MEMTMMLSVDVVARSVEASQGIGPPRCDALHVVELVSITRSTLTREASLALAGCEQVQFRYVSLSGQQGRNEPMVSVCAEHRHPLVLATFQKSQASRSRNGPLAISWLAGGGVDAVQMLSVDLAAEAHLVTL
ncbi:uncharacterized protein CIMG_11345 [Coccidioides immitis RS]|uniref:Uncharacterized protein n=1 Tax=Coccidioides immitis (strain RS) TaxID=246410 RepID=A0A0D8JXJ8_COCIM|nr:uncharacterized protein CIMG_11345 [Coccidioides immitis RS]KJF60998.1 hypothetical protein CIMG_11345 [Coccidioides immitis RS]